MRPKLRSWARSAAFCRSAWRAHGLSASATSALDVTEDGDARLESRSLLDVPRERVADAAQDDMAELVRVARDAGDEPVLTRLVGQPVALADDDDREVLPAFVPLHELRAGLLDGDRLLGDEDDVRATRDAAHHGDPPRVPAHDLDDHHAVVRLGGRVAGRWPLSRS